MRITQIQKDQTYQLKVTERTDSDGKNWPTIQVMGFGRGWKAKGTYAISDTTPILFEVVEVDKEHKLITGKILTGHDTITQRYSIKPYIRKDGTSNPNVMIDDEPDDENGYNYYKRKLCDIYEVSDYRNKISEDLNYMNDEDARIYAGSVRIVVTAQMLEKIND